ncbi:VOC family protein [Microbacterium sp. RD1]|uniref:VOC family protein n=1 Tax=Microbacterium sp. RD1 TaxID=3457313 RepID=UPI003FA56AB7
MTPQIHHAGFVVSDSARSVAFYSEHFGFEECLRIEMSGDHFEAAVAVPGARILLVMLSAQNTVLELIQYLESPGRTQPLSNNDVGAAHICITVEDIDEVYERLTAGGVSFMAPPSPPVEGAGSRFAYLRDPDGITVELLQVVPGITLEDLTRPAR